MFHYVVNFIKFFYSLFCKLINMIMFPENCIYGPYYEEIETNSDSQPKKEIILPKCQIFRKEIEEPFYYTYLNKGKEIRKYLFQYAQFLVGNNSNACYIPEDIEKLYNCSLIIDDIQDKSII